MSSLLLVGCGNMGSAMLLSWQKNPACGISDFHIIDNHHSTEGWFYGTLSEIPNNIKPDVIVFSVKPQQLADILPEHKARFGLDPLYMSIAAGKTLDFFAGHLGSDAKVVRAMPNTPALVGKAITALCTNKNVSDAGKQSANALMEAIGKTVWVDENDMDAVTAISGSGPAYVFLFLEALTRAGINAGLDARIAKTLAFEMTHGSLHLAAKSDETYEKLRQNVTSKGGTTEAALEILMKEGALEKLVDEAVKAAIKRTKTLA